MLGKFGEAIEAIEKALDMHINPVEKKMELAIETYNSRTPDQKNTIAFNVVLYMQFYCSSLFMDG